MEGMGCTLLNGWYKGENSRDLLIRDFWAKTQQNADLDEPDHAGGADKFLKKRNANLEHGFKRSRLYEITTITEEEPVVELQLPTSKDGPVFGLQVPISGDEDQGEDIWTLEAKSSRTSDQWYQYESKEKEEEGGNSPITSDDDHIWSSGDDGSSRTSDESSRWNILIEIGDLVQKLLVKEIKIMEEEQEAVPAEPVEPIATTALKEGLKDEEEEIVPAEPLEPTTPPALQEENEEAGRPSVLEAPSPADEPEKENAKPYWNKLRMRVPAKSPPVEIAKPEKKTLRKSIKKAAWKLAPWALRPVYAS